MVDQLNVPVFEPATKKLRKEFHDTPIRERRNIDVIAKEMDDVMI